MFTWVCSSCGREYDLATKQCPQCTGEAVEYVGTVRRISNLRFWVVISAATAVVVLFLVVWVRYRASRPAPRAAVPKIELERPAETPAPVRPVEITGVRLFYDAENRAQVRAVVVNHGEEVLMTGASFRVALRPVGVATGSPPLAYFTVKLASAIAPGDSRDVRAPLEALATLAAIPPWQQLRVDIE
jgi:hypothetical protein